MTNTGICFSRHARRQMKWRKVSMESVEEVIRNPGRETQSVKGRFNIWGRSDDIVLKVTIIKEVDRIVVVTVIRRR